MSNVEIIAEHPELEPEDIREALEFTAHAVEQRQLPETSAAGADGQR